ncbi:glycosyltransferase [Pedobacter sp. JCM 36344]|uniref:glycosyltransferase n=1 Tax=Pedobacter sp. JCM 36344 TaxID=3374280 RepID=UPI00397C08B3
MVKKYLASVVIVTFNAQNTLQTCLNSIYDQETNSIEIIVIDGASTDDTTSILKENNSRIAFWKSEPDNGIYDAMNKALSYISAEHVIFLGADDCMLPDFSVMLTALNDKQVIYYANVLYKGKPQSGHLRPYYQAKLGIFHQSIIYPASIFKKYKYNIKYKIAADYHLNMRLFKDPVYTFEYKNYIIVDYNDTGISAISKDKPFEHDKSKIILYNFGFKIWARYIFRLFKSRFKPGNK